jgi:hypothetical protein
LWNQDFINKNQTLTPKPQWLWFFQMLGCKTPSELADNQKLHTTSH